MLGRRINLGLVDDHQVLRDGLKAIVEEEGEGITVVLEAASAREALDLLDSSDPSILIVDISMPGMDGIELTRELARSHPEIRVIVLTMHHDADLVERAILSGAKGYILKNNAATMVLEALESVSQGKTYYDRTIPEELLTQLRYKPVEESKPSTELTSRQLEVLRLICQGRTEKEIAGDLGISFHTAHAHKSNIMQKLGLHSKVELLRYAVQRNLLKM